MASGHRAARPTAIAVKLAVILSAGVLLAACSSPAPAVKSAASQPSVSASGAGSTSATPSAAATPSQTPSAPPPAWCRHGGARMWAHLSTCGWPGPGNTGPDTSQCANGLTRNNGPVTRTIRITTPGTVINCEHVEGMIDVETQHVTIKNSIVIADSGKTGEAANGSAAIKIEDGASAVVDHVRINGHKGVMACVWDQGTSELVEAVNCFGADDGIWSWADKSYSPTTGDHFVIRDSYIHNLTTRTSNGHEDGFQTEGASYGVIEHNTVKVTTNANSALAIWDSLKSSHDILVKDNLITGGGFAIYAEDYNPGDGAPGDPPATGGFTVTDIRYVDNAFSTLAAGCVGSFGVWFERPWAPYGGGPTDGWHRHGNRVLETGQDLDSGNPSGPGLSCG
jgi:hypothetical protein